MSRQKTLKVSSNVTSLRGLAAGRKRSSLLTGQKIDKSGPVRVRASHSRLQGQKKALMIPGIFGHMSDALSASAVLQCSLESKLRRQLNGSALCEVIWSHWVTPWGHCLLKPRAQVRDTAEIVSGWWRTPNTFDALAFKSQNALMNEWKHRKGRSEPNNLRDQVAAREGLRHWPPDRKYPQRTGGRLNPAWVAWLMGYPPEWVSSVLSAMR